MPTWIKLDPERSATVKAELVDLSTKLPKGKTFAQSDEASKTARGLAISATVFTKDGSKVQFSARRGSAKIAEHVHDLAVALEAFQEREATESSH